MKQILLIVSVIIFSGLAGAQLPEKSTFTGAELQTIRIPKK